MGWFPAGFMGNLPLNVFGILSNDLLLAIPFFTLMGAILEKCGLAEDMLDSMGQLFGPVRGGLGYSVIIVGFILGAITGTVAGQVIAMAMISLPVMMRYGYNMRYATGVLAASGTITQLVPPSLVLIVLADQLGAGRRHVQGRLGPVDPAGAAVRALHLPAARLPAGARARHPEGSAHPQRLGAVAQVPARHHPVGRPDLRGAGQHGRPARHRPRHRHADRSRRDGRGRCVHPGGASTAA